MESASTSALTNGEKEALRLYLATSDPKQIAIKLGKSHHEVERRLKAARRKLGVNRTRDAAQMLALDDGNPAFRDALYRDLVGVTEPSFDLVKSSDKRAVYARFLPWATKGRPWNAAPPFWRIAAIMAGILLIVVIAILFVSLADALTRLHKEWAARA